MTKYKPDRKPANSLALKALNEANKYYGNGDRERAKKAIARFERHYWVILHKGT